MPDTTDTRTVQQLRDELRAMAAGARADSSSVSMCVWILLDDAQRALGPLAASEATVEPAPVLTSALHGIEDRLEQLIALAAERDIVMRAFVPAALAVSRARVLFHAEDALLVGAAG